MFIRVKKSKNSPKRSVQIVESYRNDKNQPRQRIVRHMGTALSDDELQRLLDFAEYEKTELEASKTPDLFTPEELAEQAIEHRRQYAAKKQNSRQGGKLLCVDLAKLREESRITIGIHEIFGKVYDEIGFDKLFGARKKSAKRYMRHITLARLANPASKRRSVADLSDDFGISLSLDSVYRMMDNIDEQIIAKGQQLAHTATKNLLGSDVSLLFYDCTTLYFESFTEDDLKKNGYSKDMKFNQPQVVLGLLATTEGLPVGYELFPGNQFEGHTLQTIIPKIKDKYHLKQVIFTADSAMLSRKNMEYLRENQVEYIVGARLKNLNKSWAAKVTDPKTSTQKIRSFDYENGQRLIVTYSDKLARKNQHDRDKAIEKLRKKLEKSSDPSSLISNYGYKKFLKIQGEASVEIDETKYEEAARFDGLHGVISNVQQLTPDEIAKQYRGLWQIEECFRISKHDLRMRPIFHWTPARIQAHVFICFLALCCGRHLAYRVKTKRSEPMSIARIVNALNHIQQSVLRDTATGKRYVLPSKVNEDAKQIYKSLNLATNTTPYELE